VALAVLLLVAACSGIGGQAKEQATAQAPVEPVRASSSVVAEGKVVPVESADLSLPSGGIVAETAVKEGDTVQAGQMLLRLEATRQTAAVAEAEAALRRAQANLSGLKAGARPEEIAVSKAAVEAAQAQLAKLEAATKPEDVKAAEAVLAGAQAALQKQLEGPSRDERIAAQQEVDNAAANLQQAQAAYDRVKGDPDIALRPEALQLQQATSTYSAAKARLDALNSRVTAADIAGARAKVQEAQARLNGVQAQARDVDLAAARAEVSRAQAQLDVTLASARPEAIAAAEADVASAQAAVDQAKAALADTELKAPFAGTVAELNAKVGEQAAPGTPLVRLADLSRWQIETDDLTELDIVKVKDGGTALLTFDAIPGLELSGKVLRVKPIGMNRQGDMTYVVVIEPQQGDPRLRWNMTTKVTIE
jgi:multidrug efflux pump subunit AcrA (membrane-fusion protein)